MSHDPVPRIDALRTAPSAAPASAPQRGDGVAFRSLLERLEQQARRLREDGEGLEDPAQLALAVDRAKSSIEDAVSLGEELLEAYRASRLRGETGGADERGSPGPGTAR